MKYYKFFPILLFLFVCTIGKAQQNQAGDIKIGFSGVPLLDIDNGYSGFILKPSLGVFLSDKLSFNTSGFIMLNQDIALNNGRNAKVEAYGFIPSWRLHHISSGKFTVYFESGIGIGAIRYEADTDIEDNNGGMLIFSGGAGINYRCSKRWELEFGLPYTYALNITNNESAKLFSGIGFTLGVNFALNLEDIKKIKEKHHEKFKEKSNKE